MSSAIIHELSARPELVPTVARWIYEEWWTKKPGVTAETIAARLSEATDPTKLPASLLACWGTQPAGTVNLIFHDLSDRPDLSPWLAALYVLPEHRGKGIGSALVRAAVRKARQLQVQTLYLYTDKAGFYSRLGWSVRERLGGPDSKKVIMQIDVLAAPPS